MRRPLRPRDLSYTRHHEAAIARRSDPCPEHSEGSRLLRSCGARNDRKTGARNTLLSRIPTSRTFTTSTTSRTSKTSKTSTTSTTSLSPLTDHSILAISSVVTVRISTFFPGTLGRVSWSKKPVMSLKNTCRLKPSVGV